MLNAEQFEILDAIAKYGCLCRVSHSSTWHDDLFRAVGSEKISKDHPGWTGSLVIPMWVNKLLLKTRGGEYVISDAGRGEHARYVHLNAGRAVTRGDGNVVSLSEFRLMRAGSA